MYFFYQTILFLNIPVIWEGYNPCDSSFSMRGQKELNKKPPNHRNSCFSGEKEFQKKPSFFGPFNT